MLRKCAVRKVFCHLSALLRGCISSTHCHSASQLVRSLIAVLCCVQEAVASELAARMNAMSTASDNAEELKKQLNTQYNRMRQATITGQILEIVGGAEAV